jgi:hypothetical protein
MEYKAQVDMYMIQKAANTWDGKKLMCFAEVGIIVRLTGDKCGKNDLVSSDQTTAAEDIDRNVPET